MNTEIITKEVMEEYEKVRSSGPTNMFDYYGVIQAASTLECYELGSLTRDEYKMILMDFGEYMKLYDIKQN